MDLQIGRGGGPRRRRTRRSDAGRIQLQGLVRVPGRVVDFLDVARRECVAVIRSFLIEWRLNVHLRLISTKRCFKNRHSFGNARKAASRFEALPRECAKSRHLSVGVVFLVSRGRCTPLVTSSFGALRGAVEGAKSRRRGGCEITTHSPWCRRMKKGREPI